MYSCVNENFTVLKSCKSNDLECREIENMYRAKESINENSSSFESIPQSPPLSPHPPPPKNDEKEKRKKNRPFRSHEHSEASKLRFPPLSLLRLSSSRSFERKGTSSCALSRRCQTLSIGLLSRDLLPGGKTTRGKLLHLRTADDGTFQGKGHLWTFKNE